MPSIRSQPIICLTTHQPIGYELFHSSLRHYANRSSETIHIRALEETVQFIEGDGCNTPFFVNVSAGLISESNQFFQQVFKVLKRLKEARKMIYLELTEESAGLTLAKRIERLRPFCAQIVMDDFGSLSSNLDRLIQIQPDAVKIDRELLQTLSPDHRYQGTYAALLNVLDRLQIEVIAEGIENETQFLWLKNRGVTRGQGFYLGPPRIQAMV
jgi:EAL domain-containing protein (putative c-di-GMP-specific phosphodiesterase class I)